MTFKNALNIAIVGLGSAGQSSSIFFSRNGHNVTVFEKIANPRPIGAGFMLQPTSFIPLKKLGIFEEIRDHGSRLTQVVGKTKRGTTVMDIKYTDIDDNLYSLGLYRGTLYSSLLRVMKDLNVPIQTGCEITDIQPSSTSGTNILVDSEGKTHGPYDLIVVADGARSKLRDTVHRDHSSVSPYKWGTLYAIVEDTDHQFHSSTTLQQFFSGTTKMMGLLPTGFRTKQDKTPPPESLIGHNNLDSPLVTLFWSLHIDQLENWQKLAKQDLNAWKSEALSVTPKAEPVLSQIKSADQIMYARYWDVRLKKYHSPRLSNVCFIGDCAHAMSPVLGQGVNLALQDALLLSEFVEQHRSSDKSDWLQTALEQYSNGRKPILRFYQNVSMLLNPWFQSSYIPGFAFTRDLMFAPVSNASQKLKREMVLTLAGARKGFYPILSKHEHLIDYQFWK